MIFLNFIYLNKNWNRESTLIVSCKSVNATDSDKKSCCQSKIAFNYNFEAI